MLSPKSPYRLGMAGFAIVGLLTMPTTAVAVDDETAGHIQHYVECLTWLITDPTRHALYCTPARKFDMPDNGDIPAPIVSIGPFTSPSAWSVSSSCEEICFPTSEPSESSESSEPSLPPTEEPPPQPPCEGYDCLPG